MRLEQNQREHLLSQKIVKPAKSANPAQSGNLVQSVNPANPALLARIDALEKENKKLNSTVEWMHQTIWELLNQKRSLEERLNQHKIR